MRGGIAKLWFVIIGAVLNNKLVLPAAYCKIAFVALQGFPGKKLQARFVNAEEGKVARGGDDCIDGAAVIVPACNIA